MMCARILRHTPGEQQSRFYHVSEKMFTNMIAFYGRTLKVVLRYQTITLLIAAAATLVLTIVLYIFIPKGFFPVQDTGVIQGITQASNDFLTRTWPRGSKSCRASFLRIPLSKAFHPLSGRRNQHGR